LNHHDLAKQELARPRGFEPLTFAFGELGINALCSYFGGFTVSKRVEHNENLRRLRGHYADVARYSQRLAVDSLDDDGRTPVEASRYSSREIPTPATALFRSA
jgi:hypothetical protein